MKATKKLFLLSSLFIVTNTFAAELHNFDQVKSVVTTGKSIRISIDFTKCTPEKNAVTQDTMNLGIFTPNEIIVDSNGRIDASLMHFTLNDPNFPDKPIYQFVRYTLTSDNNVNLATQLLDATNYASLKDKVSFDCKIDTGAHIYV